MADAPKEVDISKLKFRFTKKQDGHVLRVYDGQLLVGAVGAITRGCDLKGYESHASVVSAEILPEYRGKKLYQKMLTMMNDYVKKMGCLGIKSDGFQRSGMATRAWMKLSPRTVPDRSHPDVERFNSLYLDAVNARLSALLVQSR